MYLQFERLFDSHIKFVGRIERIYNINSVARDVRNQEDPMMATSIMFGL